MRSGGVLGDDLCGSSVKNAGVHLLFALVQVNKMLILAVSLR